ncbi:MAG: trypsin-like serine protease [Candidatus Scalindua sp.]|nr:trypsin-like serine protease [Candidatus Scalindua sp.]
MKIERKRNNGSKIIIHSRSKFSILIIALLIMFTISLAGCASYPVVGAFDDYNEVFRGTVKANTLTGNNFIEVKSENSGVEGRGRSRVTYASIFSLGGGQKGEADLEFDDGRRVRAFWTSKSLTSGYGSGHDQFGNTFKFTFGMSDQEADSYIRKKKEITVNKPKLPPPYRPKEVRQSQGFSTGTGFFVSESGHVLTNYHVVDGATTITVKDISGALSNARYLKGDSANDVALLKIEAITKPLHVLPYADIEKGSEVLTLGFPLVQLQGQEQKATFGRVNALSGIGDDVRYIQIDVPLQPGNSGGPLLDHTGSVVGITTSTLNQVYTLKQSGALPQNVNYAVKIDYIVPILRGITTVQNERLMKKPFTDLIKENESSVVMVIAK